MSGLLNSIGGVSGILGTTAAPSTGTATDGYVMTATGAGVNPAWEAAAAGGNTHASQWRITADYAGDAEPITSGWEETDAPTAFGILGASMTQSSGNFTFPATGFWYLGWKVRIYGAHSTPNRMYARIFTTHDDSTYAEAAVGEVWVVQNSFATCFCDYVFDVTSVSTHKVQFQSAQVNNSQQVSGGTNAQSTSATFIRLGDT